MDRLLFLMHYRCVTFWLFYMPPFIVEAESAKRAIVRLYDCLD